MAPHWNWFIRWRDWLRICQSTKCAESADQELSHAVNFLESAHQRQSDIVPVADVFCSLLTSFGKTKNSIPWHPFVKPLLVPAVLHIPCAVDSLIYWGGGTALRCYKYSYILHNLITVSTTCYVSSRTYYAAWICYITLVWCYIQPLLYNIHDIYIQPVIFKCYIPCIGAVLLPWFLLKVRNVRILDTFVCSGALIWLISPAWDAVKLTWKLASSVLSWSMTLPI